MNSEKVMFWVGSILCTGIVVATFINPNGFSLTAIMVAVAAAYLAGIQTELKRANDLRAKEEVGDSIAK